MKINKGAMKKINTSIQASLIGVGRDIREVQQQAIQEDVYDYYDKIRSGYDISGSLLYERTGELIADKNIIVKHSGKGKVVIRNQSYSKDTLNDIRKGNTSWRRSILASLSPSERARDFIAGTMERLQMYDIEGSMKMELYKNGIRVRKK